MPFQIEVDVELHRPETQDPSEMGPATPTAGTKLNLSIDDARPIHGIDCWQASKFNIYKVNLLIKLILETPQDTKHSAKKRCW